MAARRIGVLAAAFNPVTRAHLALVDAGLRVVDRVLCVVPRSYPHKAFEGAAFEERIEMLRRAQAGYETAGYEIAVTDGGLFLEIARELRSAHPGSEIHFLCGRDAAQRVLEWDYGEAGVAERMLQEFGLLVASRQGEFRPPERLKDRVSRLSLEGDYDQVSSSEVRRRIAAGEPWEHLVPEGVIEMAHRIYSRRDETR